MKFAPEVPGVKLLYANLSIVVGETLEKNRILIYVLVHILKNGKCAPFALSIVSADDSDQKSAHDGGIMRMWYFAIQEQAKSKGIRNNICYAITQRMEEEVAV